MSAVGHSRAREFADAIKLRIGLEIALAAVAGAAVVQGGPGSGLRVTLVTLAVLLSACAAGAYNQYAEADIDALMKRTRRRPFVTGVFAGGQRWPALIGTTLVAAVALAAWAANAYAATWVLLGAVTYGIVYTVWLKRRTWLNIVVGGFAGTFALLAGAAAVDPHPSPEATLLGVALFFWTPPHFWSLALYHKADYVAARVPMLPVLLSDQATAWVIAGHVLIVALTSVGAGLLGLGRVYCICALLGSAWFLVAALRLVRRPDRSAALACFRASLVQLSLLLLGAIADGVAAGRL
jgi:protoheme IX farnesyltransferase